MSDPPPEQDERFLPGDMVTVSEAEHVYGTLIAIDRFFATILWEGSRLGLGELHTYPTYDLRRAKPRQVRR